MQEMSLVMSATRLKKTLSHSISRGGDSGTTVIKHIADAIENGDPVLMDAKNKIKSRMEESSKEKVNPKDLRVNL